MPLMAFTNGHIIEAFTEDKQYYMRDLQKALGLSIPIALGAGILCSIPLAFASKMSGNRLTLTDNGIEGVLKNKRVNLPIDQVNYVTQGVGLVESITGGRFIELRTASGQLRFHSVYNADEFVEKTLKK